MNEETQLYCLKDENMRYGILESEASLTVVEGFVKMLQTSEPEYDTDMLVNNLNDSGFKSCMRYVNDIDF